MNENNSTITALIGNGSKCDTKTIASDDDDDDDTFPKNHTCSDLTVRIKILHAHQISLSHWLLSRMCVCVLFCSFAYSWNLPQFVLHCSGLIALNLYKWFTLAWMLLNTHHTNLFLPLSDMFQWFYSRWHYVIVCISTWEWAVNSVYQTHTMSQLICMEHWCKSFPFCLFICGISWHGRMRISHRHWYCSNPIPFLVKCRVFKHFSESFTAFKKCCL